MHIRPDPDSTKGLSLGRIWRKEAEQAGSRSNNRIGNRPDPDPTKGCISGRIRIRLKDADQMGSRSDKRMQIRLKPESGSVKKMQLRPDPGPNKRIGNRPVQIRPDPDPTKGCRSGRIGQTDCNDLNWHKWCWFVQYLFKIKKILFEA